MRTTLDLDPVVLSHQPTHSRAPLDYGTVSAAVQRLIDGPHLRVLGEANGFWTAFRGTPIRSGRTATSSPPPTSWR